MENKTLTEIEDKRQKYLEYQKQYRATHKKQKQEYNQNNKEKLAELQRNYDRERRANKDPIYMAGLKERQKRWREKKRWKRKQKQNKF